MHINVEVLKKKKNLEKNILLKKSLFLPIKDIQHYLSSYCYMYKSGAFLDT